MKKKQIFSLLLTLLMLVTILTGCGGSSGSANKMAMSAPMAAAPREEAAMDYAMAETTAANGLTGSANSGSSTLPEGRKWIITIDMNVETDDLDTLMEGLDKKINALGGYVEDQNIHNGSTYSSRRYRSANLTVRIPDEKVDQFTQEVQDSANVVSQNLNREDITLKYVATSSRVTALETEQARLLELLEQAKTMEDLLEIEARLTDVRYELENYASQLRLYDNQIDYATIYLFIEEVQEYTPVEEPGFFQRITQGFGDSLEGLWQSLQDLAVFLVVSLPYILVYGGIFLVIFLLTRKLGKKAKLRRKEKKAAPKSDPQQP